MDKGKDEQNGNGARYVPDKRVFPIHTLEDVLQSIRRHGGTGKLEINFKHGQPRGDAKWRGFVIEK